VRDIDRDEQGVQEEGNQNTELEGVELRVVAR